MNPLLAKSLMGAGIGAAGGALAAGQGHRLEGATGGGLLGAGMGALAHNLNGQQSELTPSHLESVFAKYFSIEIKSGYCT